MAHAYELIEFVESAGEFHARPVPQDPAAQIWSNRVTTPALVLGSTQRREDIVDEPACRAAGVEVVRRRSGGGVVLLVPDQIGWIDVIVPTGAPGWAHDVHEPMRWLGEHLAALVRETGHGSDGGDEVSVNRAGMIETDWSRLVCFDGVGPGEVLRGDRKMIGISQRRTRAAARLQCSWYTDYDPARVVALLKPGVRPRAEVLRPVALLDPDTSMTLAARLARRLAGRLP